MQSLLSFCSICLQLSSLGSQKSEIRLKRDESCTLCITELLQPSNGTTLTSNDQFYRETLNKGLYFENPLLQEALKLKLEQQILIESSEKPQENKKEVQDPSSRMRPQPQSQSQPPHQPNVEELFENLVQTVQKLHTPGKEDFTRQRDLADLIIDRKFQLLHILSKKANLNLPNKLSLPDNFPINDTLIEMLKSETKIFLQHEFGFQSSAHPIPHPAFQDFSQKIKELKKRMPNTQDSKDLIQEITNLQIQASKEFERVRFSYQLDVKEVLNRLHYTLRKALKYAEPIKSGLETGEKLETNGHLTSENGVFNLVMQKDWNLVLYKFSTPIWSTQTFDGWSTETQPELVFDKNSGVLKIQGPNRIVEVSSPNEKYSGNARLTINNNGTVTIMGLNQELWHATGLTLNPASDTLSSRYAFSTSDVLVSKNGIYSLILDQDCELVLYENSAPIWTSGRFPSAVKGQCELKLNEQGSLIINSGDQSLVIFPNHLSYRGKTSLLVADDGTLVVKGGDQELWKTKKESLLNDVNLSSKYD